METNNYTFQENDILWYWFVNIPGVGLASRRNLLVHFGHPEQIFYAGEKELKGILPKKQLTALMAAKDRNNLLKGLAKLRESNTRFIHWESADYPERLRNIPDPPYGLYLRGRLPDPNRPTLAMVGSRKATEYGRRIAGEFAAKLSSAGVQIISGLAEGIDTASHQGAIRSHGYTLGLVGGGIDTIFPRENFNLYLQMYEEGGVLSEWNLGIANHPGLFPIRNRLISALSDGVFVVEAAKRSGTFITVDQALEQGRTVFALPGRISDYNSTGTNQLIRDGAIPVTSPEDIIEQLRVEIAAANPGNHFGYEGNERIHGREGIPGQEERVDILSEHNLSILSPDQQTVYDLLDEQEPLEISALMEKCGYDMGHLIHILYELEMEGMIYQPRQNIYLKEL